MIQSDDSSRYATRVEIEHLLEETRQYGSMRPMAKRRMTRRARYDTPAKKLKHAVSSALYYLITAVLCIMLYIGVHAKMNDTLPGVLGYHFFTVETGSMVPTLPIGCYIVVKEASDPAAIAADTITTFRFSDGTIVTHRIIEVLETEDGVMYRTKGDNPENDPDAELLSPDRVIGTLVFVIRLPEIW